MPDVLPASPFDIDAILAGGAAPLRDLLQRALPHGAKASSLAKFFWATWQQRSGLHEQLLAACEPLRSALVALDPCDWAAAPQHPLWRILALLQHSGIGYQPELARAGEKILVELGVAVALLQSADWSATLQALEHWWEQEQQRLNRLEQRLIDSGRGQMRSRRAHEVAARLLNQTMAGKQFTRAIVDYLQREWLQELQWALLQFGADSEQWQRRVSLTGRLIESLQPPTGSAEAQQHLYVLIPDISAELAALLGERAHDRAVLEQQLALIEAQHLALLRGQPLPGVDFQLIANDDPWLSTSTSISASLLQRVTALTPGSWFLWRDSDAALRIKLALKMDDSTQLLFVNRLGVKARQQSFEEFAYLLSVGAVTPLPNVDCARTVLRTALELLVQRGVAQQHEHAAAKRQADDEARRQLEAKAKAIAEAKRLAAAQAQAVAEALRREHEDAELRCRESQQRDSAAAEQRLREARQSAASISIGSWVELRVADSTIDGVVSAAADGAASGSTQRLKVAVKLPASGKLILVDRNGVRRAEFERDEFAAKLLDGSVQILHQGPKFEDTLARVVDSMRRDRAPKE